jgi:hypothetical protein
MMFKVETICVHSSYQNCYTLLGNVLILQGKELFYNVNYLSTMPIYFLQSVICQQVECLMEEVLV